MSGKSIQVDDVCGFMSLSSSFKVLKTGIKDTHDQFRGNIGQRSLQWEFV